MDRALNRSIVDSAPEQPKHDPTPSPTPAIDWNLVHFEVGCARCGHELRGLTDPKCPACSLEFDWADAVPLERLTCAKCGYHLYGLQETRCPECGEAFAWSDALAAYHRNRQPYFEFHWRKRPVRSFLVSWWSACRPKRFWKRVRLHDNAPPIGLGILGLAGLAIAAFSPLLFALLARFLVTFAAAFRTAGVGVSFYRSGWSPNFAPELMRSFIELTLLVGALWVSAGWGALLVL